MSFNKRNPVKPQFSVATPAWNALAKLKRCVGSVRGQDGIAVEHLVQDACSTDGSPQWLEEQYRQGDTQAQLLSVSEADLGMYDAINRAWSRARGSYLSWLNADEQYLPGALALVASYFADHADVDVVFANYLVADSDGNAVAIRNEVPYRRSYVVNGFLYAYSCTLFYRRELLDRGLLTLDIRFRYAADKDLILKLDEAGVRIGHINRCLSIFGVDGNNLSTHDRARRESEQVRQEHGALKSHAARRIVTSGRRLERLLHGAYWPRPLLYQFALDEVPNYTERIARRGGRYSLSSKRQLT